MQLCLQRPQGPTMIAWMAQSLTGMTLGADLWACKQDEANTGEQQDGRDSPKAAQPWHWQGWQENQKVLAPYG